MFFLLLSYLLDISNHLEWLKWDINGIALVPLVRLVKMNLKWDQIVDLCAWVCRTGH